MLNFKIMLEETRKGLNSNKPIVLTDEILINAMKKIIIEPKKQNTGD